MSRQELWQSGRAQPQRQSGHPLAVARRDRGTCRDWRAAQQEQHWHTASWRTSSTAGRRRAEAALDTARPLGRPRQDTAAAVVVAAGAKRTATECLAASTAKARLRRGVAAEPAETALAQRTQTRQANAGAQASRSRTASLQSPGGCAATHKDRQELQHAQQHEGPRPAARAAQAPFRLRAFFVLQLHAQWPPCRWDVGVC